jgi:hypothetical protein
MHHILATTCTALFAAAAAAQCPFSAVSLQSYGNGCATVFLAPPTLSGGLDANACTLGLTVNAFAGCCNTFLTLRVLAIGAQQANVPLPQVGPGCTLLVNPVAILFLPASGGDTFRLTLPRGLVPPLPLEAQGAAFYTTFGVAIDAQLTEGQTVTLF